MAKASNSPIIDKKIDKRTLGTTTGKKWTVKDTSNYKGKQKGTGLKPANEKKITASFTVNREVWEDVNKKYPRKVSRKIEDFLRLLIKD